MAYSITTNGALEFYTNVIQYPVSWLIDATHFVVFFQGGTTNGWAQVMEVNTTTWAVATSNATLLRYDTQTVDWNSVQKVDTNHFLNFSDYNQGRADAQVFVVNTTTWEVTTAGSIFSYDTSLYSKYPSSAKVDTNHFLLFYADNVDEDGFAQVFTVNTTTWAVTTASTKLEFDAANGTYNSCFIVDTNHFINFWAGSGNDGFVQVFTVNTTTWAVTTAAAPLEFDATNGTYNTCYQIDSNHFINFFQGTAGDGFVQTFAVNTTTWEVTTASATLEYDTQQSYYNTCNQLDSTHYINFWAGNVSNYWRTQVFEVSTTTWAVTTASAVLEIDTVAISYDAYNSLKIDTNHFVFFNTRTDNHGYAEVITAGFVAPTVTTQAVTAITATSGLGNGNITDTGGANATRRGFCYIKGRGVSPTTANSVVYDDGDFGTGAFSKTLI